MAAGADTYKMASFLCLVPWQGCWEAGSTLSLSLSLPMAGVGWQLDPENVKAEDARSC